MAEALAVLAGDHRKVLELLDELTGDSGEPAGAERKALAEQLAIAESEHEAIEELCFWPLVRARLEHGDQLAKKAIEQEAEGKLLIGDLDHAAAGSEQFTTLVHRLHSAVREHIAFEENQVWPKLRLALSDEELDDLGDRLEAARRTAPTRPHPHTPPDPRILGTVGPAVGVLDRARDVLSGRGSDRQGLGRWRMALMAIAVGAPAAAAVAWLIVRSAGPEDRTEGRDVTALRRGAGRGGAGRGGAGQRGAGRRGGAARPAGVLRGGGKRALRAAIALKALTGGARAGAGLAKKWLALKALRSAAAAAGKMLRPRRAARAVSGAAGAAVEAGERGAAIGKRVARAATSPAALHVAGLALRRGGRELGSRQRQDASTLLRSGGHLLQRAGMRLESEHVDGAGAVLERVGSAAVARGASVLAGRTASSGEADGRGEGDAEESG